MPQLQLPIFPAGSSKLSEDLYFEKRNEQVTYFSGQLPVFTHAAGDIRSFRLITSQWLDQGVISQRQASEAFGISLTTIKRCLKRYRQRGAEAFFVPAERRKGTKLTPEKLVEVQNLLNEGKTVPQISRALDILRSTLHKAIDDGRLKQFKKKQ